MNGRLTITLLSVTLLAATAARAQQCSTHTTVGTYVVVCNGYLAPAPNASMVPAKLLGIVSANHTGKFTGGTTISLGTGPVPQTVSGTATINADCTGSISYSQAIGGQPAPPLNISFIVSNNGERIDGLVIDPGTVLSCELHRTSSQFAAAPRGLTPSGNLAIPVISASAQSGTTAR